MQRKVENSVLHDSNFYQDYFAFFSVSNELIYKSSKNKTQENLMLSADQVHLMERSVITTVPTTLWTEVNLILNFLCNGKMTRNELIEVADVSGQKIENFCCTKM